MHIEVPSPLSAASPGKGESYCVEQLGGFGDILFGI